MLSRIAIALFFAVIGLSHLARAQSLPITQCVSTAVAGGTGDAITIPQLPCTATSTLLVLTLTGTNSTTSPTIQQIGVSAPQVVLNGNGGGPIAAGFMATNNRVLLTYNGVNWFLLSSLSASISGLAFVADNVALAAASRVAFPTSFIRLTFGNGNGAPPSEWTSQVGTCAANSMVSDGGSCQNGSDGNSFKASVPAEGMDIRQFGVSLSGGDSSTAMQNAVAWTVTNQATLIASAGTITWSTGISVTIPNSAWGFTFKGAGRKITTLAYTGTGCAITVNYQSLLNESHYADWTMTTSHAGTASGLCLSSSVAALSSANIGVTSLERLGFQGADGGLATDYFTNAIPIVGVDAVNMTDIWIAGSSTKQGNGVRLAATNVGIFGAAQYNFQMPTFQSLSKGIYIATSNVQGIYVNQGNLSNTDNIYVDVAATVGVQGISLVNSTANGHNTVNVQGISSDIYVAFNDLFVDSTGTALLIPNNGGAIFVGNTVAADTNANGTGVNVGSSLNNGGVFVSQNQFYNLASGVILATGTNDARIMNNNYAGTTVPVTNNATGGGNTIGTPTLLTGGSAGATLAAASTFFCGLSCNASEVNTQMPMTGFQAGSNVHSIYFDDLAVVQSGGAGGAVANSYTWRCNGSSTAITTTLTGATAYNTDFAHTATLTTGGSMLCDVLAVIGGGAVAQTVQYQIRAGINP